MHGPCLAKNPEISDYIIGYCIDRRNGSHAELAKLDDSLEISCRKVMTDRLLNSRT